MDTDFDFFENRIVQRLDLQSLSLRIHEDISRSIVRLRRLYQIVSGRNSDHDIAPRRLQRGIHCVADKTHALSPPDVARSRSQFFGYQTRDLVFEAFQPAVGEGEILRIGAYA